MLKNNSGITLLILVITIVVLMILTSVSVNIGFSVINDVRIGRMISNMTLIKAKVETIYDENQFNEAQLVGTKIDKLPVTISEKEKKLIENERNINFNEMQWYEWNREVLKQEGLDSDMLSNEDVFYVNYESSEVLHSKGSSYDKINYYSIIGLKSIYQNKD